MLVENSRHFIPTTIYRPSQVICISNTGKVRKLFGLLEFLKIALTGRAKFEFLPANPNVRADMVPIGYVTDAIAYLSGENDAINRNFLLAGGVDRNLRLQEIIDLAYNAAIAYDPNMRKLKKPVCLTLEEYEKIENKNISFLALIKIYQTYLEYERDFQVEETVLRLSGAGIVIPPMKEVIQNSMTYLLENFYNKNKFSTNK